VIVPAGISKPAPWPLPARGGRGSIDHAPSPHDDIANAVLDAPLLCERKKTFDYACFDAEPDAWNVSADCVNAAAARGFRSYPVW